MSKTFNEMTKKELLQLCEDFEIEATDKETNQVLIDKLEAYKTSMDEPEEAPVEVKKEAPKKAAPKTQNEMSRGQKARLQRADLFRKEQVLITDNQNSQTKAEMTYIRWGNTGITGIQTDIVKFGKPWYVRRGALANMRRAKTTLNTISDSGKMNSEIANRYTIQELGGLSPEEVKVLANKQAIRNAGIA